jgi:hypothetical protein
MKSEYRKQEKENHDLIMSIRKKISKGEPTTFKERNILNIYNKRHAKNKNTSAKK